MARAAAASPLATRKSAQRSGVSRASGKPAFRLLQHGLDFVPVTLVGRFAEGADDQEPREGPRHGGDLGEDLLVGVDRRVGSPQSLQRLCLLDERRGPTGIESQCPAAGYELLLGVAEPLVAPGEQQVGLDRRLRERGRAGQQARAFSRSGIASAHRPLPAETRPSR